jgi:hypothetical protein
MKYIDVDPPGLKIIPIKYISFPIDNKIASVDERFYARQIYT